MKTNITILFLVFSMLSSIVIAQTATYKRYEAKSGKVNFELTGTQKGNSTLYFDDYGMIEASYENTVLEMFGIKQETNTVTFLDGYWQYTVDLNSNTGTKMKNTMLESIAENADNGDVVEVGKEMLVSMGGEKIGNEEFLGKPCEVWMIESMGTKIWVWMGITLKSETNMMGMIINRIATNAEINIDIPVEKIKVPDNIDFNEVDLQNVQDMMKGYEQEK
jgi:hypothetical protein